MKNHNLQNLVDSIILETVLADPRIVKKAEEAGLGSSIFNAVKDYALSLYDKEHPVASVLAILAPGMLTALGMPVIGVIVFLAESVFDVDLKKIFISIGESIKGLLSGGTKIDEGTAQAVANKAVDENAGAAPTEENLAKIDKRNVNASFTIEDAKLFNFALRKLVKDYPNFDLNNPGLIRQAGMTSRLLALVGLKGKFIDLLKKLFGKILMGVLYSTIFAAAGAAGSAAKSYFGGDSKEDSEKDKTINFRGLPESSSQQTYKVSPNYQEELLNGKYSRWIIQGSAANIEPLVVSWAIDVYPGLKGKESDITSSGNFQTVVSIIKDANKGNVSGMIIIPGFTSRKDLVDKFIDQVASHGASPFVPPGKNPPLSI